MRQPPYEVWDRSSLVAGQYKLLSIGLPLALAVLAHTYLCWHWRNGLAFDARLTYLPFADRLLREGWAFLADEKSVWVPFGAYGYAALFGANIQAIEVANLMLSASIVLMLYGIGAQTHSMRAGLIVSWLYALSPAIAPFVINVLTELPFLFFCTVWLWALGKVFTSDRHRWTWIAGLALACAVNVRASLVLFIYGSLIVAAFMSASRISARHLWQKFAAVQAIAAVVTTLVIGKNWLLVGLPEIALGGGNSFYLGNHGLTAGYDPDLVGLFFDVDAVAHDDHRTVQADRMLLSVGWEMLQAQPLSVTLANYVGKTWAFLFYPNVWLSDSLFTLRSWRICLIASAAVAMIRGWRSPVLLVAMSVAAYQLLVHIPLLYTPRYSESALDLWLILAAGYGLAAVSQLPPRNILLFTLALLAACYAGKTIRHLGYAVAPLRFNASVPHRILWEQRELVGVPRNDATDALSPRTGAEHRQVQAILPFVEVIAGNATIWQHPLFLILQVRNAEDRAHCYKGRLDFRPERIASRTAGLDMYYPFRLERNTASQTFAFGVSTATPTWQAGINGSGVFTVSFLCEPGSRVSVEWLAIAESTYASIYGVPTAQTPTATVSMIEYYNPSHDLYFMGWISDEVATLDAETHWVRTGQSFKAYRNQRPGTSPMCRFGNGNSHLFGLGTGECEAIQQSNPSFTLESPNFAVYMSGPLNGHCPSETIEVYRLFTNGPGANYRYTTDKAIRDEMAAKGWTVEGPAPHGVAMCAPE